MKLIHIGIINFVTQRDRKNFLHLNTFEYYKYFKRLRIVNIKFF